TVVTAYNTATPYVDNTAILDGFIITGGQSNHSVNTPMNANRSGGGMYIRNNSSPGLSNLLIQGNIVANHGGGVWIHSSTPTFTNVAIRANTAGSGGGMHNRDNSHAVLNNVLVSGNHATNGAGGIHIVGAGTTGTLRNVTITGN